MSRWWWRRVVDICQTRLARIDMTTIGLSAQCSPGLVLQRRTAQERWLVETIHLCHQSPNTRWYGGTVPPPTHNESTMALPKSIRVLAAVTLCLFFYMVVLIFRAPAELAPPSTPHSSDSKVGDWTHDPQLDRMVLISRGFGIAANLNDNHSIGRASRTPPSSTG